MPVGAHGDATHHVNPYKMTCSCAEFRERRADVTWGRAERLCEHLVKVMLDENCLGEGPLAAALANPSSHGDYLRPDSDLIFAFTAGNPLLDIYARADEHETAKTGSYARYCYSLSARRWRRLRFPVERRRIEAFIAVEFR